MDTAYTVLVVDDETSTRGMLSKLISENGHTVTAIASGEEAMTLFTQGNYPLVIADLILGEMNGIELLQKIKKINADTEVIIITNYASLETAVAALRSGAYDYITKPFEDIDLVYAVISRAFEKVNLIIENRNLLKKLKEKNEELEKVNLVLKELAVRDGLTGLYNHRYFQEALATEINRSKRYKHEFSLLFIDIDFFKNYNDMHGHQEGDKLLLTLANILKNSVSKSDVIARYGGEEFTVLLLLTELSKESAMHIAERIRSTVAEYPFYGREKQPIGKVTISVGVSSFPDNGTDAQTLVNHADSLLYKAKQSGRNKIL